MADPATSSHERDACADEPELLVGLHYSSGMPVLAAISSSSLSLGGAPSGQLDDFAKLVLTVLGTLVVAIIGAVVASLVQGSREHKTWLREKRYDAYLRMMKIIDDVARERSRQGGGSKVTQGMSKDIRDAMAEVSLLGPRAVMTALDNYSGAMRTYSGDMHRILRNLARERTAAFDEMRRALKIPALVPVLEDQDSTRQTPASETAATND